MSLLSMTKKLTGRDKAKKTSAKEGRKPERSPKKEKKEKAKGVSLLAGKIELTPILSEKSIGVQQDSIIAFRVSSDATKGQIAQAVSEQYGVTPLSVRTATFRPKVRRRGATYGSTSMWKKAYVKVDDVHSVVSGP